MLTLNSLFLSVAFIMSFSGLWAFASNRKHLLSTLLSLEVIMLGIFFLMSICLSSVGSELFFPLFFPGLSGMRGGSSTSFVSFYCSFSWKRLF